MSDRHPGTVETVTGPISAAELGITLAHEHVISDGWPMWHTYDSILADEDLAIRELQFLATAGARSVVECTSMGLGRDAAALQRVSRATGIRIVMGTGWYREAVYPPLIREASVAQLADILVSEFREGVDGSSIRAGFIGEIGTERYRISAAEERVFRAAALAQRRSGVAIITHTTNAGDLALEQVALLIGLGVPPDRIALSHVGDRLSFGRLQEIARTGAYLGIDNIGYVGAGFPGDEVRADNVVRLVAEGYAERILLGGDTCTRSTLRAYGGAGYARVLESFLPRLRERGLAPEVIESILVDNPARLLATVPPASDRIAA